MVSIKPAGSAAAEGFHDRRGQCRHKIGVHAGLVQQPCDAICEVAKCAAVAKNPYSHQHPHQVGNDLYNYVETLLCTFNKASNTDTFSIPRR